MSTRSSRFAISKPQALDAGAITWLLTQALWVGGLWSLHFVLLPAVGHSGLAPLLVDDLNHQLKTLAVALAALCVVLQMVVLVRSQGFISVWQDARGQLLWAVLMMAGSFLGLQTFMPMAGQWQLFSYLVMAFCGMLLLLQPVPKRKVEAL